MIDLEIIESTVKDYYQNGYIICFPEKTVVKDKPVLFESVLIDFFADLGVMLSRRDYYRLLTFIGAYFKQLSEYKKNNKDKINHQDRIAKAIESLELLYGDYKGHENKKQITSIGFDPISASVLHGGWSPKDYKVTIDFLNKAAKWETPSKQIKPTREDLKKNLHLALVGMMEGKQPPPQALDRLSRAI